MSLIKLISPTYIKKKSFIEFNVDDEKIVPFIYLVQDKYLQQSLGTKFYNHIKNAMQSVTYTIAEKELVDDFISPMLNFYVVYEVMPYNYVKFTNKSLSSESSEYGQPTDVSMLKYLRSDMFDNAQFFDERMKKHLCLNISDFPLYQNPGEIENLPKSNKSYFGGIYIPDKKC